MSHQKIKLYALRNSNQKISAIKAIRAYSSCGLSMAKDVVDSLEGVSTHSSSWPARTFDQLGYIPIDLSKSEGKDELEKYFHLTKVVQLRLWKVTTVTDMLDEYAHYVLADTGKTAAKAVINNAGPSKSLEFEIDNVQEVSEFYNGKVIAGWVLKS